MVRFITAGLALVVGLGLFGPGARAQNVAQMEATAKYVAAFQNPDGGFASQPGGKSSCTATVSAVRTLKYTGGAVKDLNKCVDYFMSCYDPESGGFAPTPGGKPDARTTALAMGGLAELKLVSPEIAKKTAEYVSKNAKEFEEKRLGAAGMEAVNLVTPEGEKWADEVLATRNADGSFGQGDAIPRETGSKVAMLLRLKRKIDKKEGVLAALRSGQRPDGGWSPDGKISNLDSSYRIMRAFFMMKEKPDTDRLRAFLDSHANGDGSYASKPGAKDGGGTYYCSIMKYWARQLDGEPALVETTGFQPLFNGKDLEGWEGNAELWAAKDGKIVGTSPGIKQNEFLATKASYSDFVLQLSFRLRGDASANSGVQFRSVRIPGTEMSGYQADVGQGYWGCLYDESRRNKILVPASEAAKANIHHGEWNHYVIRAMGSRITLYLNGRVSATWNETDPTVAREGKIALQIHAGKALTVEFKDILIQPLPIPKTDLAGLEGFHLKTLKADDGERKYGVSLPKGYDPKKAYPVVLFLHGSGERGEDGIVSSQIGMGAGVLAHPNEFQAIGVFPQARKTWAADSDDAKAALAALEATMKEFKCDPNKVVLTGLSMGGAGTWGIAAKHPDRFSCIVPVCGRGRVETAETLKNLPAWVIVGDEDGIETVRNARDMVRAIAKAGGSPRQTEYRGVPHNSWDRAYHDPYVIDWMLSQTRAGR